MGNAKHYIIFAILTCILSSCATSAESDKPCKDMFDESLQTLDFDSPYPDYMQHWLKGAYQLQIEDVKIYDYDDPELTKIIQWSSQNKEYSAFFQREQLIKVEVNWNSHQPTGNKVVECLGQPDFYGAYSYLNRGNFETFELELWYPEQGQVLRLLREENLLSGEQPALVNENVIFSKMTITRPGMLKDVVYRAYTPRSPTVRQATLDSLQPWPGEWELIEANITVPR